MKKILCAILLFLLSIISFNTKFDTVFAQKSLEDSHSFDINIYKDYNFINENEFYYINTETNKVEKFKNSIVTSFGEFGNTDGTFTEVVFFKKLKNGEFLILDSLNRLQFFDSNFVHLKTLQHIKNENSFQLLGNVSSITTDIYSNVYLSDYTHDYILKANSIMDNFEVINTCDLTASSKITILNTTKEIAILDGKNINKNSNNYTLLNDGHYIFSDAANFVYIVLDEKIIKLNSNLEFVSEIEVSLGCEYNLDIESGKIFYIENNTLKTISNFATDISSYTPPVNYLDKNLLLNQIELYEIDTTTALLPNPYASNQSSTILLDIGQKVIVLGETTEFENNFYYVLYSFQENNHLGYVEKKHLNKIVLDTLNCQITPVRNDVKYYKYPIKNIDILENPTLNFKENYEVNRKINYNNLIFLELKVNDNFIYVLENETINTSSDFINLYLNTNAQLKLYSNINEIKVYDNLNKDNVILILNKTTNIKIEETYKNLTKVSLIHENQIVTGFVETKFIVKQNSFIIPLTIILILISIIVLTVLLIKYKKELTKRKN